MDFNWFSDDLQHISDETISMIMLHKMSLQTKQTAFEISVFTVLVTTYE